MRGSDRQKLFLRDCSYPCRQCEKLRSKNIKSLGCHRGSLGPSSHSAILFLLLFCNVKFLGQVDGRDRALESRKTTRTCFRGHICRSAFACNLSIHITFTMTNLTKVDLEHPALTRIPPWVQEKLTPKAIDIIKRVHDWVETQCIPGEPIVKAQLAKYGNWKTPPIIHELRAKAKKEGLFNLFLPKSFGDLSPGLTNLEYSCCAEIMGRCYWAAQVRLT